MTNFESRRDFLRKITIGGAKVAGALALGDLLTACSPAFSQDASKSKPTTTIPVGADTTVVPQAASVKPTEQTPDTNEFIKPITKAEIRTLIDNLSESPYKGFIQRLGLPFFEDTLPSTITIGETSMPLYPTVLTTTQESGLINGRSGIRKLVVQNPTIATIDRNPNATVTAYVPYLYREGNTLAAIVLPFANGRKIGSGIGAHISLNFPKDAPLTKDQISILPGLRVATLIKESMTVAVNSGMMASIKIDPLTLYNTQGGKMEVLSQTYTDLLNQLGKFAAYMDWIPFILGIKALQDNPAATAAMRSYSTYNNTVGEIIKTDFGNRIEDLIPNSAKWIRQNIALMNVIRHIGDFNQEP